MLDYVTGSLFDSPAQTLVNTVNTDGVMGKGIALEFKRRFPEMFEKYREFCKNGELTTGKLYLWRTPNKWVLNFPTKRHWRHASRPEYIEEGLKKFVSTYTEQGITSVSFPQLGCGNGGLSWETTVRPMMDLYLKRVRIPVFIHMKSHTAGFVPEHIELNSLVTRTNIGFVIFLNDLRRAAGMPPASIEEIESAVGNIDVALPGIRLGAGSEGTDIAGEDLRDLWNTLRARGAVSRDRFPGSTRAAASQLIPLLLGLEYVRPIEFANPKGASEGIRLAPTADMTEGEPLKIAEGI